MSLSFWEIESWLNQVDFTVVGSGIVGLSCALELRRLHPKAKILILEKGMFPQGASTKNAGFACFGSLSEILDDLNHHSEEEVLNLVHQRVQGLQQLRAILGDTTIDYQELGGYELFLEKDQVFYEECVAQIPKVNQLLQPLFSEEVFSLKPNAFKFNGIVNNYSFNKFEGQIDTGKMMQALIKKAYSENILIINNCQLIKYTEQANQVTLLTHDFEFNTNYLMVATNGFAQQLVQEEVLPARAQVLMTTPIPNLEIKGTFHLDKGYYYFRNINDRILFGGGRNLDFKTEETAKFGLTDLVQERLETLLKEVILKDIHFEVEHRWSGIMGVGHQKKPIIKAINNRVFCGVRLGGMGIAIGSAVGKDLANLTT